MNLRPAVALVRRLFLARPMCLLESLAFVTFSMSSGAAVAGATPVATPVLEVGGLVQGVPVNALREDPRLHPSGAVSILGWLSSGDTNTDLFWWTWRAGAGSVACREGTSVPSIDPTLRRRCGGSGSASAGLSDFFVAEWPFEATDPDLNVRTLALSTAPASFSVVAREGAPAPGVDADFGALGFSGLRASTSGQLVFTTPLQGGSSTVEDDAVLWSSTGGAPSLVVREGDSAPGVSKITLLFDPLLAPSGDLVFIAGAEDASAQVLEGVWKGTVAGNLSLVALTEEPAPGGSTFVDFRNVGIDRTGTVAFEAVLSDGREGLWIDDPLSPLRALALEGAPAPGGGTFLQFGNPALDGSGQAYFHAVVDAAPSSTDVEGFFAELGGTLVALARTGQNYPGLPAGTSFSRFQTGPEPNLFGQLVFAAELEGDGIGPGNDRGIWFLGSDASLVEIARDGQSLAFPVGAPRTVLRLGWDAAGSSGGTVGLETGRPMWFDHRGQVTFWAEFQDGGQGVYVTQPVPSPYVIFEDGFESGDVDAW